MKRFKKIMTTVLAGVMCIGCGSMAMAAETTAVSDTGTITISGIEEGLTVNAYQIATAEYDETGVGEFVGYKMVTSAGGFSIDQYGNYNEDALTEENLSALFTAVQGNGVFKSVEADADGVATFENMPVGSYLFVVTGSETTVYGMVIGSVYYAVDETTGEWAVVGGEVDVEGDDLWVKASEPTITKEEVGGSIDSDDWSHGGSADIGDTLEYHITVANIPSYKGTYPEFYVTDIISDELEITDDELNALYVMIDGVQIDSSLYTVERTENGFKVDFVVDGVYTLNDYAGKTLIIDFCADVISADFDADDDDHSNEADLIYTTTSYIFGFDGEIKDTDHDYTFNAKIQKVDQDGAALEGAEFSLFTDEDCSVAYKQNGVEIKATSGADGYFEFSGLEEGTYYMKETKAPYGYVLNTNVYKIVISASYDANGEIIQGYTITVYDTDNGDEVVGSAIVSATNAKIANTKVGKLPSMGGMGTLTFTIIGCAVIVAAAAGVVVSRRRSARTAA